MAGPWESYAPAAEGPWAQYQQEPQRGVIDKLLGQTGPRYQTWPERAVREAFSIPEQAITAATSAQPGSRELTQNMVGPAAEAAATFTPTARGSIAAFRAPARETLEGAAKAAYNKIDDLGVEFHANALKNAADLVAAKIGKQGATDATSPETFKILGNATAIPKDPSAFATTSNFDNLRQALGEAAKSQDLRERRSATLAIKHLDDYLGDIPPADVRKGDAGAVQPLFREARGNYGAARRSEKVSDILDIAEGNAEAVNSGRNLPNQIRQGFNRELKKEGGFAGYTADEIAQAEKVRGGTFIGNRARDVANLGGAGGGLGMLGGAYISHQMLEPILGHYAAGVAPAVAGAAAALHKASTYRQANKLDEMIRMRAPMTEALMKDYVGNPTANIGTSVPELLASPVVRALIAAELAKQKQPVQ